MIRQVLILVRECSLWLASGLLMLVPLGLALDFGGFLYWSQWFAAVVVVIAVVASLTAHVSHAVTRDSIVNPLPNAKSHMLFALVAAWAAFCWFQTVPLPLSLLNWLSPGAHDAYTQWLGPLGLDVDSAPISVAPEDSLHGFFLMLAVLGVIWVSPVAFSSRGRINALLFAAAMGGATIGVIGVARLMFPEFSLWSFREGGEGSPFSTFINRNNAALFMNLGLAASLGILSWRLSELHDQEVDVHGFQAGDFLTLVGDRRSMLAMVSGVLCLLALLVCRSRSGVAAVIIAAMFAFGWVRQRRGTYAFLAVAIGVVLAVLIIALPSGMRADAIERFQTSFQDQGAASVVADARLTHWPDGWRSALQYLPAGSGLGTYSYAYLPYQDSSSWRWYHHADNLWLELFVEQGLVGIGFTIAILFFLIRSLLRMAYSHDPMDEGLRIMGWYLIGALLTSQLFDFGLIAPANLFLVAALLPILVRRGQSVARFNSEPAEGPKSSPIVRLKSEVQSSQSGRALWLAVLPGSVALVLVSVAVVQLKRDTEERFQIRSAEYELREIKADSQLLESQIERLEVLVARSPNAEAYDQLADYQFQLARLHEVAERQPRDEEEAAQLYQATAKTARWLQDPAEFPLSGNMASHEHYRQSQLATWNGLVCKPLALPPRVSSVYLQFMHQGKGFSQAAVDQAAQLYRNSPLLLLRLGDVCAATKEYETALTLWRRCAELSPELTIRVIVRARAYPAIKLIDLIPEPNYQIAADYLVKIQADEPDLYRRMLRRLSCKYCRDAQERHACEQLVGDLSTKLNLHSQAAIRYRSAVKANPLDASVRWKLVAALDNAGLKSRAIQEARQGQKIFGDDPRFSKYVEDNRPAEL